MGTLTLLNECAETRCSVVSLWDPELESVQHRPAAESAWICLPGPSATITYSASLQEPTGLRQRGQSYASVW